MTEIAVFAVFALATLVSAIVVVANRNPVYSTISLVVTLLSTAVLYILLAAPFLAALQVLLYTGAILVLFLFVIMLLNVQRERTAAAKNPAQTWGAAICAAVLLGITGRLFWASYASIRTSAATSEQFAVRGIAEELFSRYLLPFEIIGLLLLVAVVAASWVAKRPELGQPEDTP